MKQLGRLNQRLEARGPVFWTAVSAVAALLIGLADYVTGHELSFSLFYVLPVAAAAWYGGRTQGYLISALSALVWCAADIADLRAYQSVLLYVWNPIMPFGFFIVNTALLSALRGSLLRERSMARTDSLTGALNSRAFAEILAIEMERARRYRHHLTVAYLDLDNFKQVNDTHGHSAGDDVLRAVVDITRRNLRAAVLEQMKAGGWPVTVSVGVLTCGHVPASQDDMLKRVDDLMYEVKRSGKDGVRFEVCAGEGAGPQTAPSA